MSANVITDPALYPPLKPVDVILDEAADLLEEEGRWIKGDWNRTCEVAPDGISHCADGAISRAAGVTFNFRLEQAPWGDPGVLAVSYDMPDQDTDEGQALNQRHQEAYDAASAYTRRLSGDRHMGVIAYNDSEDTDQTDVVTVLRAAAAEERARVAAEVIA